MSRFHEREQIENLSVRDVSFTDMEQTYRVENLNVDFKPHSIYLLKGEISICTEFLKILSAIKEPTQGEVLVNGQSVHQMTFEEFLPYRLNIGLTFAIGGTLSNRTIRENLMLPFLYHEADEAAAQQAVDHMISWLDIEKFQNQRPASVPGYVRKLTSIGRTLALEPQILLLDDPISSLNHATIQKIKLWIYERLHSKKLLQVIVASEDLTIVEGLSHQTIDLWDNGSIGHMKRVEAV